MQGQPPLALFFILFPILFVGLWVSIGLILGMMSGWHRLQVRFPDRADEPLAKLGLQSAVMGAGVRMNSILTFTLCRGGVRIAIWRIFGFFCAPFYVPWRDLSIRPARSLLIPRALLEFGHPAIGRMNVSAKLAARLARAAEGEFSRPTGGGRGGPVAQLSGERLERASRRR
jgi:hypothetical protein